jgi:GT2 family glycosyltransferase
MTNDDAGVVIIGRNEGERLIACLASVRAITTSIVYVDSGSTDGSVSAAGRAGIYVILLDSSKPFSAARARNEGFTALKTLKPNVRFVQFIDGDCVLVPGWLDTALSFVEKRPDIAVVCGRRREINPSGSIYNQLFDLEWDTPIGEAAACGGDALVRTQAFETVGGFCSHIIAGEEPELCIRLRERGWKIWRLDADMTRHDAAMTRLGQWWLRSVRSGYGCAEVMRLHRHSPYRLWGRAVPSAILWGGLLPAAILVASLLHPVFLFLIFIYLFQIFRIAIKTTTPPSIAWAYGILTMIAKFAQLQGIAKFYFRYALGRTSKLIEYKR